MRNGNDVTAQLWAAVEALQAVYERAKADNAPNLPEIESALADAVLAYKRSLFQVTREELKALEVARANLKKFAQRAAQWPFGHEDAPADHEKPNRDVEDRAPVVVGGQGSMAPLTGNALTARDKEYMKLWGSMVVLDSWRPQAEAIVDKIISNQSRYVAVVSNTQIPWWFVGLVHSMECSLRFDQHLHNGDPLTARTFRKPPGRPPSGFPPFTWEESAKDALEYDDIDKITDWSIPRVIFYLHSYNGIANEYSRRGIPTPYLWSGTQHYKKGKYTRDGHFDPEIPSGQVGAAVLLRCLIDKQAVSISSKNELAANVRTAAGPMALEPVAKAPGMAAAINETIYPGNLQYGSGKDSKSKMAVRRVQEWLNLNGNMTPIDGDFGSSTKIQLERFQQRNGRAPTGTLDEDTWVLLTTPLVRALAKIDHGTSTSLQKAVTRVAQQHVTQLPREVGGQNKGPWVRLYMDGNDGKPQEWCAGFCCLIVAQAARDLGMSIPFPRQVGVNQLVADAKKTQRFLNGSALGHSERSSKIPPGSLYVFEEKPGDWSHCGFVKSIFNETFDTYEGNTSGARGAGSTEARSGNRNYTNKDFILLL